MEHLEEPRSLLEDGLLQYEDCLLTGYGSVNNKGELAVKREIGTSKACLFMLGKTEGIYILTLSATIPELEPMECVNSVCPSATLSRSVEFFLGLFMIALGTGGTKPCIWPFGADQFDDTDHRFQRPWGSPLTIICQVVVASLHKWKLEVPQDSCLLYEIAVKNSFIEGSPKLEHSNGLRRLDKAAAISNAEKESAEAATPWRLCTVTHVEELRILIHMFPIWATGIIFCAVYAQMSSLFVEQGKIMDTTIASFAIPAASLSTFDVIGIIIWVVSNDRGIVPIARKFTGKDSVSTLGQEQDHRDQKLLIHLESSNRPNQQLESYALYG